MLPVWQTSMGNLTKVSLVRLFVVHPTISLCVGGRDGLTFYSACTDTERFTYSSLQTDFPATMIYSQQLYIVVKIFTFQVGVK